MRCDLLNPEMDFQSDWTIINLYFFSPWAIGRRGRVSDREKRETLIENFQKRLVTSDTGPVLPPSFIGTSSLPGIPTRLSHSFGSFQSDTSTSASLTSNLYTRISAVWETRGKNHHLVWILPFLSIRVFGIETSPTSRINLHSIVCISMTL